MSEKVQKKSNFRILIILLLILVLASTLFVGYFLIRDRDAADLVSVFKTEGENTILLDEFIVNLKSEKSMRNYLKIKIALMYTDEKQEKNLSANVNKIRDVIINQLRSKTPEEILDIEKTSELKKEIVDEINSAIKNDIVKDIYFTDLVIQ